MWWQRRPISNIFTDFSSTTCHFTHKDMSRGLSATLPHLHFGHFWEQTHTHKIYFWISGMARLITKVKEFINNKFFLVLLVLISSRHIFDKTDKVIFASSSIYWRISFWQKMEMRQCCAEPLIYMTQL